MSSRFSEEALFFVFAAVGLLAMYLVQSLSLWIPAGCLCLGALGKGIEDNGKRSDDKDSPQHSARTQRELGRLLRIAGISGVASFGAYAIAMLAFR
jgi:hypothetical protein